MFKTFPCTTEHTLNEYFLHKFMCSTNLVPDQGFPQLGSRLLRTYLLHDEVSVRIILGLSTVNQVRFIEFLVFREVLVESLIQ